jgi:hypothetical protein
MKLPKKHAEQIATLINTIAVADIMYTTKYEEGNKERARYYLKKGFLATVALGEDYGIYLPTYKQAVEYTSDRA